MDMDSDASDTSDSGGLTSDEDVPDQFPMQPGSKFTPAYTLLTIEELSNLMNHIIDEVVPVIDLPRHYLRLGLSHFAWDKDRLVDHYYDHGRDELLRVLRLPRPDTLPATSPSPTSSSAKAGSSKPTFCEICCSSRHATDTYALSCGHIFCRACWLSYLREKILSEGQGNRILCPAFNCPRLLSDEAAFDLLKLDTGARNNATRRPNGTGNMSPSVATTSEISSSPSTTKQRFQKLLAQSFVQCNPELTWCPNAKCCYAARLHSNLLPDQLTPASYVDPTLPHPNRIECECGEVFCHRCGQSWHEPLKCAILELWLKKTRDDSETSNWISANTKDCPKCHATIEKAGGCNHMVCKNISCRYEFCWVCLGAWDPHGSSWYNCSRYNEDDTKKARDAQEASRSALQRYLFYFNRYANHLHSLRLEKKLYDQVGKKMEEIQALGMSWIEVQFLKQAVDVLSTCRRALLYTYVFAYYLKANNQVHIFEDNQRDLELATEKLSEYLERNITKDSLSDMKQQVQDKTRYCEARRIAMLRHVYEGYDRGMWHHTVPLKFD